MNLITVDNVIFYNDVWNTLDFPTTTQAKSSLDGTFPYSWPQINEIHEDSVKTDKVEYLSQATVSNNLARYLI